MIGKTAQEAVDNCRGKLEILAQRIWENPETAYEEAMSSELVAEFLEKEGFRVERKAGGVPTAIRAVWGEGRPMIGFLGEYDALPGMSQKAVPVREAVIEGGCGHGCGHNLLAATAAGGAVGLKAEMEKEHLSGTVVFYGCPAEEVLTGKPFMAKGGCFQELDAALAWHPGRVNRASALKNCGCDGIKIRYQGVTAHAAYDPWNGRSALDAVQLLNMSVEFMREHVRPDVRIHYTITGGGVAPNIVPETAEVWYFIRALNRSTIDEVRVRLLKAAEGAAMMTETKVQVSLLGGCYPMLGNLEIAKVLDQAMREVPQEPWTEEDLQFAEMLNLQSPEQWERNLTDNGLSEKVQMYEGVAPINVETGFDSTDVGDVAHIVPTGFFTTATSNLGAPGHSWQVTACAGSTVGKKGMIYGAKAMAVAGAKLVKAPEVLAAAKEEFCKEIKGETYCCPITGEVDSPF